jgi:hypothetical protein
MKFVKIVECLRCGVVFSVSADKVPDNATRRNRLLVECPLCGKAKARLIDSSLFEAPAGKIIAADQL